MLRKIDDIIRMRVVTPWSIPSRETFTLLSSLTIQISYKLFRTTLASTSVSHKFEFTFAFVLKTPQEGESSFEHHAEAKKQQRRGGDFVVSPGSCHSSFLAEHSDLSQPRDETFR